MINLTTRLKLRLIGGIVLAWSASLFAQTLASLGPTAPTPGPNDISQLSTVGDQDNPDGINYYNDKGTPVGQTFTTGSNPQGYVLTSLAVKSMRGNGNGGLGPNTYTARIYQISGATATLLSTYNSDPNFSYASLDWLQFTGLATTLAPNTTYAYTWSRSPNGWDGLGNASGNPYAGGQVCAIPVAGGTVTIGSGVCDAAFNIGLDLPLAPIATTPAATPNPVYALSPLILSESASGQDPLAYQWRTDGGSGGALTNIPGATSVTITNFPADQGITYVVNFDVIVTNSFGAATSAVVAVTVDAATAPFLTQDITPVGTNVYGFAQGGITFAAAFNGTQPISYQWQANTGSGFTNIPFATNATLTVTNLQFSQTGGYQVIATNVVGISNSSSASLVVLSPPAPLTPGDSYAYAVYTNNPLAYWRLRETTDVFTNSMQAYDYSGHHLHATYGHGAVNSASGPQSPTFPGFEADNTGVSSGNGVDGSWLDVPDLNLNTNTVTISAWIKPNSIVGGFWGLFMWRGTNGDAAGLGFGGTVNGSGVAELGYTWNTNSSSTWGYHSGLFPVAGEWSFVSLVITPTNSTIYLYSVAAGVTNLFKASQALAHGPELFNGGTIRIGSDNFAGRNFDGIIDEVSVFNRSLREEELQVLFLRALGTTGVPPGQPTTPASVSTYEGQTVQFTSLGGGVPNPTYQWQSAISAAGPWVNLSNVGRISGANSSTLTISNTIAADAKFYRLSLTNALGSAASAEASLTLQSVPQNGLWTVNYVRVNLNNGNSGIPYSGRAILGNGTFWNKIEGDPPASTSSLKDDGVTESGITFGCATFGGGGWYSGPNPANPFNQLLDPYFSASAPEVATFSNIPNGVYNLALFGIDGAYVDRGTTFTVNGVSQFTVNVQDRIFSPGDNTVLYTGVVVTNGTLDVHFEPHDSPAHTPNNEGPFNGAQLQAVSIDPVTLQTALSGSTLTLSWANYGTLLSATNVAGPWVPVAGAVSPFPITTTNAMQFFRIRIQ